ncbi:MAG: zf-HC2 domain-containing protein [Actinomycetota bacterium]|nr:zf-HC2 domain-containing protein [Actinomycetota bacterium]
MSGIDIPCAQIVEMVTDYLEDALDPEQRQLFEEHLADCPPCTRYVDHIQVTLANLGAVQERDLSEHAWAELRSAFRELT